MNVSVLSGSARKSRNSHNVSLGLLQMLSSQSDVQTELIDLRDFDFDQLSHTYTKLEKPNVKQRLLAAKLDQSDAFILVSPEYNGSYSGLLKTCIDMYTPGFRNKPIGVSCVTTGKLGGIRGAMQMQQLVLGISGFPMPRMLLVPEVKSKVDSAGNFIDSDFEKHVAHFIGQFLWFADALISKSTQEQFPK